MTEDKLIVALVDDLFFGSQIGDVAENLGYQVKFIKRESDLDDSASLPQPCLVIVDLMVEGLDWARVLKEFKANASNKDTKILAFGPHEDLSKREAAIKAGCDIVVARSKFVADLPALIGKHARM